MLLSINVPCMMLENIHCQPCSNMQHLSRHTSLHCLITHNICHLHSPQGCNKARTCHPVTYTVCSIQTLCGTQPNCSSSAPLSTRLYHHVATFTTMLLSKDWHTSARCKNTWTFEVCLTEVGLSHGA